jgi:alkanesulfonate monooxygenase SsuD/methylene tetrahydromethanopterin reductase-like flavin-dependent oxidoreductase (luciferase family)
MEIGIGLPATIPGVEAHQLTEWARRADDAGFSTLGVIDRIVYPNYDPLIAVAAAAAVTERIRLTTSIVIVPYRVNAALLAKQVATIHDLSGGRFVFGAAVGGRDDDYEASHVPFGGRGSRFEEMIEEMKELWGGAERGTAGGVGPKPESPPPIILGGSVDVVFERAARYGEGWMMGGGTPDQFAEGVQKTEAAWTEAGRDGEPRKMALGYYSLGADAEENANRYLKHYYAWLGDEVASMIAGSAATDEDTVKEYISAFSDARCDEYILFPCSPDPDQVDLLASAAL